MTYIRNINHKTKCSSMVAHPSPNNKVVGWNPCSSIFCAARSGYRSSNFFVAKLGCLGAAGRGLGAARLGLGVAGWGPGAADQGWPGRGRGRGQPLPAGTWSGMAMVWPGVGAVNRYHHLLFFYIFSIFHCIYKMAMCCFLSFYGFSFLDFFHS
jgi:hypothetical protein